MSTLYTCSAVERLMRIYNEKGGEITEIEEGTLGYGLLIMHGDGLKTTVVREVYLNEWSSAHTIRKYKKCPKKYMKMLKEVMAW